MCCSLSLLISRQAVADTFTGVRTNKTLNNPLQQKIFERSFVYMSKDLSNVPRDWTKVVGVRRPTVAVCARKKLNRDWGEMRSTARDWVSSRVTLPPTIPSAPVSFSSDTFVDTDLDVLQQIHPMAHRGGSHRPRRQPNPRGASLHL